MLAIMGAMDEEVRLLRAEMTDVVEARHACVAVATGEFLGVPIALAQCGVGKVNAAICTQMLINLYRPRALVFSGVAGGLQPGLRIGDMVIASHLVQYDIDLTAFGRRHGELPNADRVIASDPHLVGKAAEAFEYAFPHPGEGPRLNIGTVVSGDRFVGDSTTLKWLQDEFGALATEMEGAAVGYTCQLNALPFVVTRGLTDAADELAPSDYATNLEMVCRNSFRLLEHLIPGLAPTPTGLGSATAIPA